MLIAEACIPSEDLVMRPKADTCDVPGNWYTDGRPEHLREALDGSLKRRIGAH